MATTPNGIMALPENDQMGAPQLSLNESYDAMRQGLKNARPDAAADVDSTMAEILPQLEGMPDDVIDKLLQTVQYLKDNPDQYAEIVAKLINMGVVKEGDFPPEYDPEFLATMGVVLLEAQRSRSQAPLQPTGFANGGLADAARIMAAQGRGRDSVLAHITPSEARLLRSRGGMGTRNPSTGLPEYGFLDDLWGGVKGAVTGVFDAVKGVLKSPIGRVVGTIALGAFLGPGAFGITGLGLGAAAAPLASGLISGLSGGSAMDMLTSAATSYLGSSASPLSQYIGGMTSGLGLGSMATQALNSGLVGTGVGLLTGRSLEDSVSSGLQGAVMNTAMDYMNSNKGPVSEANRAPVSDAVIKPVPGLNEDIGSNLKQAGVSVPRINNPSAYVSAGASPTPLSSVAPAPVAEITPAPVVQTGGYQSPDLMDSAGKMFQPGRFMEGFKDTFSPSGPTSAQVTGSTEFKNLRTAGFSVEEAFKRASDTLSPGMLRQYGPLAAAGLGIMGLTGGFDQKPLQQSAVNASLTGGAGSYQDLMTKNPRKYYAQNLPGVLYDNNGAIIGFKGPGGSRQLYNQGGAVGYANGGEATATWEGPAWGPNSMVYPSRAAAIAAGVPANKLFKTAAEAYRGKANIVTPYVPVDTPVLPSTPDTVLPPILTPVELELGGGGRDSGYDGSGGYRREGGPPSYDYGGSSFGADGSRKSNTGLLSGILGRTEQAPAPVTYGNFTNKGTTTQDDIDSTIAGLSTGINTSGITSLGTTTQSDIDSTIADLNTGINTGGITSLGTTTQSDIDSTIADLGSGITGGSGVDSDTGLQGQGLLGQTGLYGDAAAGSGGIDFGTNLQGQGYLGQTGLYGDAAAGSGGADFGTNLQGQGEADQTGLYGDAAAGMTGGIGPLGGGQLSDLDSAYASLVSDEKMNDAAMAAANAAQYSSQIAATAANVQAAQEAAQAASDAAAANAAAADAAQAASDNADNPADVSGGDISGAATGTSGGSPADAGDGGGAPVGGGGDIGGYDGGGGGYDGGGGGYDGGGGGYDGGGGGYDGGGGGYDGGMRKGGYIGGYAQGGIMSTGKVRHLYDGGDAAGYGYGEGEGAAQGSGYGGYGSLGEGYGDSGQRSDLISNSTTMNTRGNTPVFDSVTLNQANYPIVANEYNNALATKSLDQNQNLLSNFYGYQNAQQARDAYDSFAAEQSMRNEGPVGNDRAKGGMMGPSGIASLLKGGYPRKTGEIAGPGTGTSDDIPAMLSDGEFVMTAKAVRGAGKGSRRDGAKRMYALMHQLERNAARG